MGVQESEDRFAPFPFWLPNSTGLMPREEEKLAPSPALGLSLSWSDFPNRLQAFGSQRDIDSQCGWPGRLLFLSEGACC